jgi:phage recombination protein Bet
MTASPDLSHPGASTSQESRLPWNRGIKRRFGIDRLQWIVLTEVTFPNAASERSIEMALAYCKVRNLDVFKRPVHIVQVYDPVAMRTIDTVWPGISELRTTAMRTGQFAGFDQTEFGPRREEWLGDVEIRFPEWARCTVYRIVAGARVAFVGPKVVWIETYGMADMDVVSPNAVWRRRPKGQLEKCAEAAALRRAFPEELGSEYAAEEIDGRTISPRVENRSSATDIRRRLEARSPSYSWGFSRSEVENVLLRSRTEGGADAKPPAAADANSIERRPRQPALRPSANPATVTQAECSLHESQDGQTTDVPIAAQGDGLLQGTEARDISARRTSQKSGSKYTDDAAH